MAMTPDPTFPLVLYKARGGQQEAINYLCCRFYPIVSKYVIHHVPHFVSEDITQDIFVKMVRDIQKVRANDETAFSAWIFAIAYATIASYHRTKEHMTTVTLENAHSVVSPDDPTQQVETQERLTALIEELKRLSTEKREVVISRANGQKFTAIATRVNKSVPAVRKIDSRTRYTLKQRIEMIIVVAFVTCSLLLVGGYVALSQAQPGSKLYPLKRWIMPATGSSAPTPHTGSSHSLEPTPTTTPTVTPTPQSTPTPAVTPTPQSKSVAPAATAAPENNGPTNVLPTGGGLPVLNNKQKCLQGICLP